MELENINGSGPGWWRKMKIGNYLPTYVRKINVSDCAFIFYYCNKPLVYVNTGNYLSTYVRKINVSGSAFCIYSNKPLVYGNTGKKDLLKNVTKSTEHLSNRKKYLSTILLPLHLRKPTSDSSSEISICTPLAHECTITYAHTTATCPSLKENISRLILSVLDCKHHIEAYVLSCVAENSLPLSVVPRLIGFSQFLSRDPKALSQLQMNWTATSYKLKHGL